MATNNSSTNNKFGHAVVDSEEPQPRGSRRQSIKDSLKARVKDLASDIQEDLKDAASCVAKDLRKTAVGDVALDAVDVIVDKVGETFPNSRVSCVLQGVQDIIVQDDDDNDDDGSKKLVPARLRDYSHTYWDNCWRRYPDIDKSPDILCFETGHYGLSFNVAQLSSGTRYQKFDNDRLSYTDVLAFENRKRMDSLDEIDMTIEVEVQGKTYRAISARPVNKDIGLCNGRLWEGGRIANRIELVGIIFQNIEDASDNLQCNASIWIMAWPQKFAISLSLKPAENTTWQEGAAIRMKLGEWTTDRSFNGPWIANQKQEATLTCNVVATNKKLQDVVKIAVTNKGAPTPPQTFNVDYKDHFSCFHVDIMHPKRAFMGGYTDIRQADTLGINIQNSSEENVYVPVVFFLHPTANPTGLVPMLFSIPEGADFVPSGIPIQTSKNWHYAAMGNYLYAYAILPVKPGTQDLEFRVYYGFYGPLCSASHANLSLVGWPSYSEYSTAGRWEQLAIGCFGETFCIDIEMSATTQAVTDVRALMVQKGMKWRWTNAGWGGDWLCVADSDGRKLLLGGVKVAYLSQGPCLTEVQYTGYYGAKREVYLDATVHTLRANDYARTIQKLRYDFNATVAFTNRPNTPGSCLFRVGGGVNWEGWYCKKVAIGNSEGLIEDYDLPPTLQGNSFFLERKSLDGPGPWWVAFPESGFNKDQGDKGIAWKGLIIRSFESVIGGNITNNPSVSFIIRHKEGPDAYYVDALVTPPEGVNEFQKDDSVFFYAEWITVPYNANDYYGDNQTFKQHLQENPKSWKTLLREAAGNELTVDVKGGEVVSTYPLIVSASEPVIELKVTGGVGAVPVRFEGLSSSNGMLYDNSSTSETCSSGEKWFETSYDPNKRTYSKTYNLLLDDRPTSSWVLK